MSVEANLAKLLARLAIELPAPAEPKGVYRPILLVDNLAYSSGHLPIAGDGRPITGRVGEDLGVDEAYAAARLAGLGILATFKQHVGYLDRVRRVVKVLGMVNCTPDFTQQPAVVNGCSELFAEVFGPDAGVGVRSAVGVGSLPLGVPVEIEAVFQIR